MNTLLKDACFVSRLHYLFIEFAVKIETKTKRRIIRKLVADMIH